MLLSGAIFIDRGNSKDALHSMAVAGETMRKRGDIDLGLSRRNTVKLARTLSPPIQEGCIPPRSAIWRPNCPCRL